MRSIAIATAFMGAAFLLAGCQITPALRPDQIMMAYNAQSASAPAMKTVDQLGTYELYPDNATTPIASKHLWPGDRFGFAKDADGKLVGLVVDDNGNQQLIPLTGHPATNYYWKYE
jgi:hypothetical protein